MQCETDKATIDYEEHGEGRPILLLHGWTMDRRVEIFDYEKIFALAPRLAADLSRPAGHGPVGGQGRASKPGRRAGGLLAFIDRVLPTGGSCSPARRLGAYLARAVAARRRSRIAGLLLRVPASSRRTARRTLPSFQAVVARRCLRWRRSTTKSGRPWATPGPDAGLIEAFKQSATRWSSRPSRPLRRSPLEIRADPKRYGFSFDLAEAEKGFEEPTLIIAARQDMVVGYRDAWTILESYPRATFAVVDRADHGWPVEKPDLLAALIDDWLARICRTGQPEVELRQATAADAGCDPRADAAQPTPSGCR